jgi:lysozyme family protein
LTKPKKAAKPGVMEYQLESLFRHVTYNGYGCRNQGARVTLQGDAWGGVRFMLFART